MASFILKLYHYLREHRLLCFLFFFILSGFLILQVIRLNYKEDISDFLPFDETNQNALNVYQNISGANNIFTIFQYKDTTLVNPDNIVEAINEFLFKIEEQESLQKIQIVSEIDIDQLYDISDYVYRNIPYFLQKDDYERIDSLLADSNYIERQLQLDKQMLLLPGGGMLSETISKDPLNLFKPVTSRLQSFSGDLIYEMYGGYIFSPGLEKAIVMIKSPYGSSETENNGQLISQLQKCADSVTNTVDNIDIHFTGGPAIAVGNASQIKNDSILSVTIAIVIILLLLLFTFRNVKNLILIAISIAWGWLFGLGGLSFIHNNVSIIVIGISSVILGIAVNYPLHLIGHLYHCKSTENALREIASPLIVGNITTVGAFMSLIPLESVALRDLGIFSSFLLIGTIILVLIFLPHIVTPHKSIYIPILEKISNLTLEKKPIIVLFVVALTFIFGYFSLFTKFDSDISHINYMTEQQKDDMAFFQNNMTKTSTNQNLYVISSEGSLDKALNKSLKIQSLFQSLKKDNRIIDYTGCSSFLTSSDEQQNRIDMWNNFVSRYSVLFSNRLRDYSIKAGFSPGSFDDFYNIISSSYTPKEYEHFELLANNIFSSNIFIDSLNKRYEVVDVITVSPTKKEGIKKDLEDSLGDSYIFDVQSMNSALANNLSNNFNYIGWACALIVFFFLWFSLGSIELAILSFLPMAISWIWILGIMVLLGIQFNIVNIILATFIFGQGDDYTIFMTEGSCYEYAYHKKMLSSYKSSIIISALIMFVGIGSLIVAKHPALHSLAEVTIIGMFSVVLMAYIFPPLVFNILVKNNNHYRIRPLSLIPLLRKGFVNCILYSQIAIVFIFGLVLFDITNASERKKLFFRRFIQKILNFDFRHIPGVKYEVRNPDKLSIGKPALLLFNHQSVYDITILLTLSHKLILINEPHTSSPNRFINKLYKWLDFHELSGDFNMDVNKLQTYKNRGYSLFANYLEDNQSPSISCSNKRMIDIAEHLQLDIIPVVIHGINHVLPDNDVQIYTGIITVSIQRSLVINNDNKQAGSLNHATNLNLVFNEQYEKIANEKETANYYSSLVIDRYRYKGVDITNAVKKNLSKSNNYSKWIDIHTSLPEMMIVDTGLGEFALLYSLVHKKQEVTLIVNDDNMANLVSYCTDGIIDNLKILTHLDNRNEIDLYKKTIILVSPNDNIKQCYSQFKPIII